MGVHPALPPKLLAAIEQGRCLLLFDGFDEVGSGDQREQIAEALRAFISYYSVLSAAKSSNQSYNRIVITSHIVGYGPDDFPDY